MLEVGCRCQAYVGSGVAMGGVCRGGVAMRGVCWKWGADGRRMLEVDGRCEAYVDWGWPL